MEKTPLPVFPGGFRFSAARKKALVKPSQWENRLKMVWRGAFGLKNRSKRERDGFSTTRLREKAPPDDFSVRKRRAESLRTGFAIVVLILVSLVSLVDMGNRLGDIIHRRRIVDHRFLAAGGKTLDGNRWNVPHDLTTIAKCEPMSARVKELAP